MHELTHIFTMASIGADFTTLCGLSLPNTQATISACISVALSCAAHSIRHSELETAESHFYAKHELSAGSNTIVRGPFKSGNYFYTSIMPRRGGSAKWDSGISKALQQWAIKSPRSREHETTLP